MGEGTGDAHPFPPPPRDDLRLSNTTGILKKKALWFIGVEVKHETRLENLMLNAVKLVLKIVVP